MSPWILTFTGKKFDLLDPQVEQICIEDIAHALSNQCRFAGHTKHFYSVAQHSIILAENVVKQNEINPALQLRALLHDAAEAYMNDIPAPMKWILGERLKVIEDGIQAKIHEALIPKLVDGYDRIKKADLQMLALEKINLLPDHAEKWEILEGIQPLEISQPDDIRWSWANSAAKKKFIDAYKLYLKGCR
jgi:hypothetical protein